MYKIIIIGSGLAGIAAAKKLIARGIKPIILDTGVILEKKNQNAKDYLSKSKIEEWDERQVQCATQNNDLKKKIPRKYFMGSSFFYGKDKFFDKIKLIETKSFPAFSYAKSGLSNGWGSAILPLPREEQCHYPFKLSELDKYYKEAISGIPYTAEVDGLSDKFNIIRDPDCVFKKDAAIKYFEKNVLLRSKNKFPNLFNYGSSRLLCDNRTLLGCRICGECMSGCFNDHIYKPGKDLDELIKQGKINYLKGCHVHSYSINKNEITVKYRDENNSFVNTSCSKLILAAGAVNTTRIYARSNNLHDYKFKLLNKNGIVLPIFGLNYNKDSWPNRSTLPFGFMNFNISPSNLVYSQLSRLNELIIRRFNNNSRKHNLISKIISGFFVMSHINFDSTNSDYYDLFLTQNKTSEFGDILNIKKNKINDKTQIKLTLKIIKTVLNSAGYYPISLLKRSTISQHNGGTMPMKKVISNPHETNEYGQTYFHKNVYAVDTSVLPHLSSTPIGLPLMANAMRICDNIIF
ncbi:hypothetical protein N9481_04600 [Pelagibacteraceae bacterium]|nr:hypothetical protein [Pelagibacteraceae bacterium]